MAQDLSGYGTLHFCSGLNNHISFVVLGMLRNDNLFSQQPELCPWCAEPVKYALIMEASPLGRGPGLVIGLLIVVETLLALRLFSHCGSWACSAFALWCLLHL
mmetsp:Transcript_97607/g.188207  ORF Transcript_97607/g.188207 Transcript_97607/m.188207 type:complete len:103 (+) Transcript_97607:1204-1512(+)